VRTDYLDFAGSLQMTDPEGITLLKGVQLFSDLTDEELAGIDLT
jgi:hypothetical protein